MNKSTIIQIISSLLILLFTYTALSKIDDYNFFKSQLHFYPLLKHTANFLAWALPAAELIISILLFFPATRLYGFYCSALILIVFTIYLVSMIMSHNNLPCSCGGVIKYMTWPQHIIFNLFFLITSITGIVLEKQLINCKASKAKALRFSA